MAQVNTVDLCADTKKKQIEQKLQKFGQLWTSKKVNDHFKQNWHKIDTKLGIKS